VALVDAHPPGRLGRHHPRARRAEIADLFADPALAHARRLRFTTPRQANAWLAGLPPARSRT